MNSGLLPDGGNAPKTFVRESSMWTTHDDGSMTESYNLLWTDGDDLYLRIGIHPRVYNSEDVDLEKLSEEAVLIPRSFYQAIAPDDLTVAPTPPPKDSYLKISEPDTFVVGEDDDKTSLADTYVREARVFEELMKHPHPNICAYRGVVCANGHIKGLCLKRYGKNIFAAKRDRDEFDADRVMDGIRQGLAHLHKLGYVHNDINPANIVLDEEGQAVIIDFGSCVPTGSRLSLSYGTPDWTNEANIASEENDFYGLEKLDVWIREEVEESPATSTDSDTSDTEPGDSDRDD